MVEPSPQPPVNTFVIRFYREWSTTSGRWRGRIEHVQSGLCAHVCDLEGVTAFLQNFGVLAQNRPSPERADK